MLTHGQAACLVLDKKPTHSNRQEAKSFFLDSPLAVVYLADGNPLEPMIVAESIVVKNPYKYKRYPSVLPETTLPSPTLPTFGLDKDKIDYQDSASPLFKSSTSAKKLHITSTITMPSSITNGGCSTGINDKTTTPKSTRPTKSSRSNRINKSDVINYLKTTYRVTEPENSSDYDSLFLTNVDLYQELKTRYPHIEDIHSLQRVCIWLNREMDTFGPLKARRVGNLVKKGRVLWKPKRTTI